MWNPAGAGGHNMEPNMEQDISMLYLAVAGGNGMAPNGAECFNVHGTEQQQEFTIW